MSTTRKHIIIDIGHARNTGAVGSGLQEHTRCGQIAGHLRAKLEAAGYMVTVIDFPDKDNRADLVATAEAANRLPCTFGISLHMDAATQAVDVVDEDGDHVTRWVANPKPSGAHVCYVSATGKRIAESIARYLCTLLPGRAERVQKRTDLYILTHTRAPWVLCECGFITNPGDVKAGPDAIAEAIARGILKYEGRGTKDEF